MGGIRFAAGMMALLGLAGAGAAEVSTQIRWTAYGVPHIKAADERGLGYGIGYAYAKDNLCLLADEIVTARGERARFFGREGQSSAEVDNVTSDLFFRWLNEAPALDRFLNAQREPVRHLLQGYVQGYNRYLRDTAFAQQPLACRGQPWLQPLTERDLASLTRRLLVEGGIGRFAQALVAAAPPGASVPVAARDARGFDVAARAWQDYPLQRGSNALAVGKQRSANGHGLLLANPHFPWSGALRFYQMHLTIPGQLDVMGAALPGLPVVNIGFNQHLAWTHTVDTSAHFTLHRLALDPADPTRYRVDDQTLALEKRTVSIDVREADGTLTRVDHDLYLSRFGPVVKWPGMLEWEAGQAYALQDVNLDNDRVLQQWLDMDRATSLAEFRGAIQRERGIPWVNTLAVDQQGEALYMNASVVPDVSPDALATCMDKALAGQGLPVLDGSRSACDWVRTDGTPQPGIVPAERMPQLQRQDFLQNSNDSAWMTNPAQPLEGYSPLVSREGTALGLRARFALQRLRTQGDAALDGAFLRSLVDDNRVYLAELLGDDLNRLCDTARQAAARPACEAITRWSRRADPASSVGWLYFQAFAERFLALDNAWRVPFDAANPLDTPRGIALDAPAIVRELTAALVQVGRELAGSPALSQAQRGALQVAMKGNRRIPMPGGAGELGVYNAIQSRPVDGGQWAVVGGSSYIQLVSFDEQGPQAQGLLTFSQSSDPASPHFLDQTDAFAQSLWHPLPFTEAQILADPAYRSLSLRETVPASP
ncbi:bifunctional acylase PvdQ [Pseudomonas mangiferae]|nr:acylase [Pseudomonas mangiferae]